MNNQEFERKMNSIIEQQALFTAELDRRFAADLERRRQREAEFDERHRVWKIEIDDILTQIAKVTRASFDDFNAKMNALIDAQIRMEEQQRKTEESLRLTAEQQRITEEHMRLTSEQQRKTDEQLRRTDQLLRRHLT